ncbi:amino acid permease-domain-containing protein, partial [Amylostereum chailletii]
MSSHNVSRSPDIDEKTRSYDVESMHVSNPETSTEFYNANLDRVQRKLNGRHMQMFAIGTVIGTVIGTGLFLGMGQLLAVAGPLGALLVFIHVGGVGYASLASITEMATFTPMSGSMSHYAARWVDPALGFAVGWNYFYTCAITLPAEITAAAVLIGYWDSNADHVAIYIAVFILVAYAVNLIGARTFGNTEIVFSTLKLMLVAGLVHYHRRSCNQPG